AAKASRQMARVLKQSGRVKQELREGEERYGAAGAERRRKELLLKGDIQARIGAAEHFGAYRDARGLPALVSALNGLHGRELGVAEQRLKAECETARAAILGALIAVAGGADEPAWKR